ncbi:MAG: hypothetical protein QXD05_02005 [Candidatus Pacearchaeota archaeon]
MTKKQLNIPILLIAFNRPETTRQIFFEIKKVRPKKLFVSVDGPRNELERQKVDEVKKIVSNVDWPCKLKKRFLKKNGGIIRGSLGAINWFFNNVEEGIIFDDDCVPSQDFFRFCEEMLLRYKNNERIMHICGTNPHRGWSNTVYSYYFSKYTYMWGWASWKRAWKKYDKKMKNYLKLRKDLKKICPNIFERLYIRKIMDDAYTNPIYVDTKWLFSVIFNRGLAIVPVKNLITNVGFIKESLNTKPIDSYLRFSIEKLEFPLKHPHKILLNQKADERYVRWLLWNKLKKHFLLKTGLYKLFYKF